MFKDSNILGVESRVYDCGFCLKQEEELAVPWEIYSQWLIISQKMAGKEWGCVFTVEDGEIISYRIPEQEVTGSSCEFKEDNGGNGIMHSHHDMGAFHSHQDDKQARNLYEYSIVLSSNGYDACRKVPLPCGGYGYTPVTLTISGCELPSLEPIQEKKREGQGFTGRSAPARNDRLIDDLDWDYFWERDRDIPLVCPNCHELLNEEELEAETCRCGQIIGFEKASDDLLYFID